MLPESHCPLAAAVENIGQQICLSTVPRVILDPFFKMIIDSVFSTLIIVEFLMMRNVSSSAGLPSFKWEAVLYLVEGL